MSRPSRGGVTILRTLPHDSPVHRLWAGTKLLAVGALAVSLAWAPSWAGIGLVAGAVVVAAMVARVPVGAIPRPPRWFWVAFAVGALLTLRSGGAPFIHVGTSKIGLGGLDSFCRFTALALTMIGAAAVVGWTTPLAEVAPALARLGRPLRWLRLPVEEWAITVALCVRCLPLLIDELRTLMAARQLRPQRDSRRSGEERESLRPREVQRGLVAALTEGGELLLAVLAVSLRRAGEMGEAIVARGGAHFEATPARLRRADGVALTTVTLVVAGVVWLSFLTPT
jgi:energy-coupling factor transport system permease protein